jgi:nucleotide-binding universal stress UspA family protein
MIHKLLVPLDGLTLTESILPVAAELAARTHARVTLLHVLEQSPPQKVHGERHLQTADQAREYLQDVAARFFPPEVKVDWHVHEQPVRDVADSLGEHSAEFTSDLVIMCMHGERRLRDRFWGNLGQQVAGSQTTSVLLLRAEHDKPASFPYRRILVPLDGQPDHEQCLPLVTQLASVTGAEVIFLCVVPTDTTQSGNHAVTRTMLPGTTRQLLELSQQTAVEYLQSQVEKFLGLGIRAVGQVCRGDVVKDIQREIAASKADLVALTTHGRIGLEAFWAGSVADRIARSTDVAMLLTPVTRAHDHAHS